MKRFILQSTKGLVEIAVYGDFHRIQFVHESVRQHLLGGGLKRLYACLGDNVEIGCHAKLAEWCQAYIRLVRPEQLLLGDSTQLRSFGQQNRLYMELPLLDYAYRYTMWHIKYAYAAGAYALESSLTFPLAIWIDIDRCLRDDNSALQRSASHLCLCRE